MIPVFQTKFENDGNCYAACLASILELCLEDIPDFPNIYSEDEWFEKCRQWCRARTGMDILKITFPNNNHGFFMPGYCIGVGKVEGFYHAVICRNGKVVHDPFPGEPNMKTIEYAHIFVVLDPARAFGRG